MDRRKFIKTSLCIGCGTALIPACKSPLLTELSYKFSKDKFIYKSKKDLPKKVCLEACTLCQLNCPACELRSQPLAKDIIKTENFGYLKFSDFKNFIDDNPQIESVELSNKGEIFLNPELDKIIEYAYKKNIELTAFSGVNLNDLSDEMAETLVKYKFRHIVISIDGATPDIYKIYRVGGDFNKVMSNIQKIDKYKKLYNSEFPVLFWKFIVFGHNEHEIELAKQKAKKIGMEIDFQQNFNESYSPVKNKKLIYKQTGLKYDTGKDTELCDNNNYEMCKFLFESPQINWNGNLLGCCNFMYGKFGVNVFKVGLLNALNSTMVIDSKHMITDPSYVLKTQNPCMECWYYKKVLSKRKKQC